MSMLINPIIRPSWLLRGWRLVAVLGLAASAMLALTGTGSATPPDPCDIFFGF
jgi:hypothetical protein